MAEIEAEGEIEEVVADVYSDVKSVEEKTAMRFEAIKELSEALERVKSAMEKTSCGYCVRDLTIAEVLIQNILDLMVELVSETGKKDGGG